MMVWLIKPHPLDPVSGVVPTPTTTTTTSTRAKDQRGARGAVGMFSRAGRPLKPIMIYVKDQVAWRCLWDYCVHYAARLAT